MIAAPTTGTPVAETLLDVQGMTCPLPVLKANKTLRSLPPGALLRVLATDIAAQTDFPIFCQETGHILLSSTAEQGVLTFLIQKRSTP